jgi:predicted phosphodiesterase
VQDRLTCPNCFSVQLIKSGVEHGKQRYRCKRCGSRTVFPIAEEELELVKENVRYKKQKQKAQDVNRVERKAFREYARVENAVEEYSKELKKLFENYKLHTVTKKHNGSSKAVGVIQFSDVHFNELVNIKGNKYDFEVASQRCQYFVSQAKKYFRMANIKSIVVALTGDLLNSDRRLDELLNQASNRAKATFLSVDIMQQVLLDLNKDFNVSVASVVGNEGRANKELGWSNVVATDNYDYTIYNCLRYLFRDSEISFIDGDPSEVVVNVAGQNLLMLHGHGGLKGGIEKAINQIIGRYAVKGINIDFVIFGHVHSARVGDNYARSSSMVGANDYSEKALNLSGRASQNCYVFYNNGNRDGIKIDLQNVNCKGYKIDKELEAYNAKSAHKTNKNETIIKIVV